MSNKTINLDDRVYNYLQSVSVRETEILRSLREETATHPMGKMQIAPEQGQFMAVLVKLMGAKKTIEVGVFTGYSSLVVALALPDDGKIVACDVNEEYTAIARRYWEKAGVANKIDLHLVPAIITLETLIAKGETESFDFAFIDANKSDYDRYYELCLQLIRPGGLIAIDNVLWYGKVADLEIQDNRTKIIRNLNEKIYLDDRVDVSLIPIGDGLTLAMKK
ncbi:MAG: class I SAM-dependent methyltransferase [Prochloraceae cyanobacterium]